MCLETVASKEELEKWKARKGKYVKVYKVCREGWWRKGWWEAVCRGKKFYGGWNMVAFPQGRIVCLSTRKRYPVGFHSFIRKSSAREWFGFMSGREVVTAYVPTKSIRAIGKQDGRRVIVSTRIYMPKYPEVVAEVPK